jgi:hypothetical protein
MWSHDLWDFIIQFSETQITIFYSFTLVINKIVVFSKLVY